MQARRGSGSRAGCSGRWAGSGGQAGGGAAEAGGAGSPLRRRLAQSEVGPPAGHGGGRQGAWGCTGRRPQLPGVRPGPCAPRLLTQLRGELPPTGVGPGPPPGSSAGPGGQARLGRPLLPVWPPVPHPDICSRARSTPGWPPKSGLTPRRARGDRAPHVPWPVRAARLRPREQMAHAGDPPAHSAHPCRPARPNRKRLLLNAGRDRGSPSRHLQSVPRLTSPQRGLHTARVTPRPSCHPTASEPCTPQAPPHFGTDPSSLASQGCPRAPAQHPFPRHSKNGLTAAPAPGGTKPITVFPLSPRLPSVRTAVASRTLEQPGL